MQETLFIDEVPLYTIDQKLLALSWKQPFGTAMLHGKIETRTWQTKYRGWVMICTSKMPYTKQQIINIAGEYQFKRLNEVCNVSTGWFGHAIAIGKLIDCRPMRKEDEDKCFVEFYPDLFCHVYDSVKPIKPIIWKGTQGWKEVTKDIKEQIVFL